MNLTFEQLNRWRAFVELARSRSSAIQHHLSRREVVLAIEAAKDIFDGAVVIGLEMETAGAERPGHLPERSPLALELHDTPANRKALQALEAAADAMQKVDRERGYGDDGPGSLLRALAEMKRLEIYGPEGAE